jgi:hypothetical protein
MTRAPMPRMVSQTCHGPKCGAVFQVRAADLKRGWGKFCSKSCKAKYQTARMAGEKLPPKPAPVGSTDPTAKPVSLFEPSYQSRMDREHNESDRIYAEWDAIVAQEERTAPRQ